jgi:hypothetical protein
MNSKALSFTINKCSKETLPPDANYECESPGAIDEFIKQIQVETYSIFDHIEFKEHENDPLFRQEKYLSTDLLDPDHILRNYVMLRKNDITTEDSLFSTDETTFTHLMYDIDELKSEKAFPRTDQNSQMVFNNIYMVQ